VDAITNPLIFDNGDNFRKVYGERAGFCAFFREVLNQSIDVSPLWVIRGGAIEALDRRLSAAGPIATKPGALGLSALCQ
jgi:hypothetical protein